MLVMVDFEFLSWMTCHLFLCQVSTHNFLPAIINIFTVCLCFSHRVTHLFNFGYFVLVWYYIFAAVEGCAIALRYSKQHQIAAHWFTGAQACKNSVSGVVFE